MKKHLITLTLLSAFAAPAMASPFYIDNGVDFGANDYLQANGDTTTGWLKELTFKYDSYTEIDLLTGQFTTEAGWDGQAVGGNLSTSAFTGLNPSQVFGDFATPSANGFDNLDSIQGGWDMTFTTTGLTGLISGTLDAPELTFTGGEINFWYRDTATTGGVFVDILTFDVTGSLPSADGTELVSTLSAVNEDYDIFQTYFGSFGDSLNDPMEFVFAGFDFNTGGSSIRSTCDPLAPGQTTCEISGNHDGSVVFAVPEPTSVALLGLGLLGLAGSRRRKQ